MRSTRPLSSKRTKVIAAALAAILLIGIACMAIVQSVANRGGVANQGWLNGINVRQQRSEDARRQKIVNDLKALGREMHNNPVR
jgi:hypothetical protein